MNPTPSKPSTPKMWKGKHASIFKPGDIVQYVEVGAVDRPLACQPTLVPRERYRVLKTQNAMAYYGRRCIMLQIEDVAGKHRAWLLERTFVLAASQHGKSVCECGTAKTGIQNYGAGHSHWCPVAKQP